MSNQVPLAAVCGQSHTCQFTRGCKLSCLTVGLSMAVAVKMCHLLSAACQNVTSLGRWPVITLPLSLLGAILYCCQDASPLGSNLSRCIIFRQVVSFFMVQWCPIQFTNGCKLSYFILGLSMAVAVKMFHL